MDVLPLHQPGLAEIPLFSLQFRLWLHALAYQLIVRLRDYLQGTPWQKLEVER